VQVANLEAQVLALEDQLYVLHSSRSFRYAAPLRALAHGLRGLRGAKQP
jgi:hypothetical protein